MSSIVQLCMWSEVSYSVFCQGNPTLPPGTHYCRILHLYDYRNYLYFAHWTGNLVVIRWIWPDLKAIHQLSHYDSLPTVPEREMKSWYFLGSDESQEYRFNLVKGKAGKNLLILETVQLGALKQIEGSSEGPENSIFFVTLIILEICNCLFINSQSSELNVNSNIELL